MKKIWTKEANRALIQNVTSGTTDNVELAQMLNMTIEQVYDKRYQLGLVENNYPRRKSLEDTAANNHTSWSKSDQNTLTEMYHAKWSDVEIAEAMGRTVDSISTQRKVLRLVRGVTKRTGAEMQPQNQEIKTTETDTTSKPIQGYVREFSFAWGLIQYRKA